MDSMEKADLLPSSAGCRRPLRPNAGPHPLRQDVQQTHQVPAGRRRDLTCVCTMNATTKFTKATKGLQGLPAIPAPRKTGRSSEVEEVETIIRSVGGRPMSRSTKQRLAKEIGRAHV